MSRQLIADGHFNLPQEFVRVFMSSRSAEQRNAPKLIVPLPLTLKVPVTAIDALQHFETG